MEEADSEGWSGRSDNALDAETEEEGWGQDTLTVLPWGTQESGVRGIWLDVWSVGSNGRKAPSATADEAGTRGRHGAWHEQGAKKGGRRGWEGAEPLGVGGNLGVCEASKVDPETHGVEGEEGGREASGVEENPGTGRHGVGRGVELSQDDSSCHELTPPPLPFEVESS